MQTITPSDLKLLLKSRSVEEVKVIAKGNSFYIQINGKFNLIKARSGNQLVGDPLKTYSAPNSLFSYLHSVGIKKFEVDMSKWTPSEKE
ncbi:hypothetical protein ACIPLR_25595 [Herbaspirillum huttiense]|uniref:hypothetical protein n=1 Tax=Herbaspirillum huttiense TaxID=863372 RepID=UPI0038112F71